MYIYIYIFNYISICLATFCLLQLGRPFKKFLTSME